VVADACRARFADLADLMRGEEDRRTAGGCIDHQVQHVSLMHGVQPGGGLVEHQYFGVR